MNTIFEPLKLELFEQSLFIQDNKFIILYSSDIRYEDYGYEYYVKSLIYVQLKNNVYSLKLFRLEDEKMVSELKLEIKNNLVYLLDSNIITPIKSVNNINSSTSYFNDNLKFLVIFFLRFIHANSKDLVFGAINQENKEKYKQRLPNLSIESKNKLITILKFDLKNNKKMID